MKVVMAAAATGQSPGEEEFLIELRAAFPDVSFRSADTLEEQMSAIRDADVYYGWPPREVFMAARRLRWVHMPGTGIDKIATAPELIESDVVLTNARGPHAPSMADHVMGMMVILAHRWRELFEDQRSGRWDSLKYYERYLELEGRTVGILALGDLGMAVARRAHGFGMSVFAVDKHTKPPSPYVNEVWGLHRLDELLSVSDWFVVTAPYTSETSGLIDGRRLELLKEGAFVIVISRGGIVDEEALAQGLRSGRIAGAGLDAFVREPLPEDSPFWGLDNVVLTPHSSSVTPEMFEGRRRIFKENLRRFLAGEPFLYVCDKRAGY